MYIETPKPPLLLGFRLTVYPSPHFLQINGRLYHPSLPHLAVEGIKLSMAPSLHPHYQTSLLLWATPPSCFPSALFPCPLLYCVCSSSYFFLVLSAFSS